MAEDHRTFKYKMELQNLEWKPLQNQNSVPEEFHPLNLKEQAAYKHYRLQQQPDTLICLHCDSQHLILFYGMDSAMFSF